MGTPLCKILNFPPLPAIFDGLGTAGGGLRGPWNNGTVYVQGGSVGWCDILFETMSGSQYKTEIHLGGKFKILKSGTLEELAEKRRQEGSQFR